MTLQECFFGSFARAAITLVLLGACLAVYLASDWESGLSGRLIRRGLNRARNRAGRILSNMTPRPEAGYRSFPGFAPAAPRYAYVLVRRGGK